MPLDYAILIVLAIYLAAGIGCAHWLHRPRRSGRYKERTDAD